MLIHDFNVTSFSRADKKDIKRWICISDNEIDDAI